MYECITPSPCVFLGERQGKSNPTDAVPASPSLQYNGHFNRGEETMEGKSTTKASEQEPGRA